MTIVTDSGRLVRNDEFLAVGGQGLSYLATDLTNGKMGVVKLFHERYRTPATVERIRFLVDSRLHTMCHELRGPIDVITCNGMVGHFTPYVSGKPLEVALQQPEFTFIEGIGIALNIAQLVKVLHDHRIVYGDIQLNNFIIRRKRKVFKTSGIDFDNFSVPGLTPPPEMYGHVLHLAPEIRTLQQQRRPASQSIESDRYSLTAVVHQVILLTHPASGHDHSEEELTRAMSGKWPLDPACNGGQTRQIGGYPISVLNSELCGLMRNGLSASPPERPSADKWVQTLSRAINRVYPCPICDYPTIVDSSKTVCPSKKHDYPTLTLVVKATGKQLSMNRGTVVIGRNELGGSMNVSNRHAILRRFGPEIWMESIGKNGSYRWSGSSWTPLPYGKPVLLAEGNRLRLAGIEVQIANANNQGLI